MLKDVIIKVTCVTGHEHRCGKMGQYCPLENVHKVAMFYLVISNSTGR